MVKYKNGISKVQNINIEIEVNLKNKNSGVEKCNILNENFPRGDEEHISADKRKNQKLEETSIEINYFEEQKGKRVKKSKGSLWDFGTPSRIYEEFLVAQQFKDPVLSLLWHGSLLVCRFNP